MTSGPVIIAGAGHAGFQLAASLRQNGFAERIALVNDEGHLPYQRPPLSKAYLKGTGGPDTPDVPAGQILSRPEYRPDRRSRRLDRPRRAQSVARIRRFARLRPSGAGDRRAQPPARYSQRQSRRCAVLADARRQRGAAEPDGVEPACRRDRRRLHRAGIRRDRAGQGPRSRRGRTRRAGDGARGDRGNLGVFQAQHAAAGIRIHLGVQVTSIESRRRQGDRRQPQRRPAPAGGSRRGRRRRVAQRWTIRVLYYR